MAADDPPQLGPSPPRAAFVGSLRNGLVFLTCLFATSSLLTAFTPFPSLGNLWRKYQHLKQHGQDYSVIYLGSSRVFHEFIPRQFDADLAGKGHQVRSFNFGQDGMWPPESLYMVREILKLRPPKLKWVLIDLMAIKGELPGNETTKRAVYWHDFRHTLIACRHVIEIDMDGQRTFSEKLERCWMHASVFAQRATSLGRGFEWMEIRLKLRSERKAEKVRNEGHEAAGKGPLTGRMLAHFNRAVNQLKKKNPGPRVIQPVLRDALDDLIAEVRAAGAEPIFVVASSLYGAERFRDWPPERVTVLRFDDPIAYPDLYDPEHRYDPHHLDEIGAQSFTRHLAEQFADVLDRKR